MTTFTVNGSTISVLAIVLSSELMVALVSGLVAPVEGELDRFGVEVVAVVELDPLAQGELPGRRVQPLPRLGEGRHQVALGVASGQSVVDVDDEDLGVAPDGQVRVEGVRLGGEADPDLAGRRGAGRRAGDEPRRRGDQAQSAQRGAPAIVEVLRCSLAMIAPFGGSAHRLRRRSAGP